MVVLSTVKASVAQALAEFQTGAFTSAGTLCDQILRSNPDDVQALHLSAAIALITNRAAEGASLLQRVVALSPNNEQALATLGEALAMQGDAEGAVDAFTRALAINVSNGGLQVKLGEALSDLKRFEEAEAIYRCALEVNPSNHLARFNLAKLLTTQNRLDEAASTYRDLLAREKSREALFNLGLVLMDLHQYESAAAVFRQVIAWVPLWQEAQKKLGDALAEMKKRDEAAGKYAKDNQATDKQAGDTADCVKSMSLILCTRNREEQLRLALAKINDAIVPDRPVEIVLIDMGSTDHTQEIFKEFAASSKWPVKFSYTDANSLGAGRNRGIELSSGELLAFTDDDCYIQPDHFVNILAAVKPSAFQYGMGEILLYDEDDDDRVANYRVSEKVIIPENHPYFPPGTIQGANMFFLRRVFDKAGMFEEAMGAGTKMGCEDIEMAARASWSGFTGAQLPGFSVYHHHQRKKGSPEADRTVQQYEYGAGAYLGAVLLTRGTNIWDMWHNRTRNLGDHPAHAEQLRRVARELVGAARYFDHIAAKHDGLARGAEGG